MNIITVKMCCPGSIEEAQKTIDYDALALGLVGKMPSGSGVIDDELIARIARPVPLAVSTFLLNSETQPEVFFKEIEKI